LRLEIIKRPKLPVCDFILLRHQPFVMPFPKNTNGTYQTPMALIKPQNIFNTKQQDSRFISV
jgi:hypothetical protein